MRTDIDPKSIVPLRLIGRVAWQHKNRAIVEAADYNGHRARTPSGEERVFLSLTSGDDSVDWLDITDHVDRFMIWDREKS